MPSIYTGVQIDLEIDEFLDRLDDDEFEEVIRYLVDNEIASASKINTPRDVISDPWNDEITKLYNSKHLLTKEDELTILNITKKLY
jgi:hypothetical protein